MKYWKRCDGDFHSPVHTHRAIIRGDVMSIGFEGYADFTAVSLHDVPRLPLWSAKSFKRRGQTDKLTREHNISTHTRTGNLKRSVSSAATDRHRPKKVKTATRVGEDAEADDPSVANSGRASRVATAPTSKSELELEQSKKSITKAGKSNATSKPGKTSASKDDDGDSEDLEIVEIRTVTPAPKRKRSVTSQPEELAKKRPKTIGLKDTEDEAEVISVQSSATTRKNASRKAVAASNARRTEEDSDDENSESDEEEGGELEVEEPVNPQAAQKLGQAKKDLKQFCRNCKSNVSKAMKEIHGQEISKLKREHRDTLRERKEASDEALKAAKAKIKAKNAAQKAKHTKEVDDLREDFSDKVDELREKQEKALKDGDEKYKSMKQKLMESNVKLTKERDDADAKRKKSEKDTNAKLKGMTDDAKAGELKLKEERKQLRRECQEQVDQLKPGHSSAIKDKDKIIGELADKAAILENRLGRAEHDLQLATASAAADRRRYEDGKAEVQRHRASVQVAEDNLRDFNEYLNKVEGRAQYDTTRLEEHLQEHKNRVVTLQRENYANKEALRTRARLCAESNDEVKRLKELLRVAQAEVGLAAHLDGVAGSLPTDVSAESPSSVEDLITFD